MGTYKGLGRRGGDEELWQVTYYADDLRGDDPLGKRYRAYKRGRIFNGLRYPSPWSLSWEVVWKRGWRRWEVGWAFETIGYNDEQYGVALYLLPLAVYLHLDTHGILPKPKAEREWKLIAMVSEGVARDVSVHYQLGPGGINSPWKDKQGRKVGGVWSLLDWMVGRNVYVKVDGEPFHLDVPLPERTYTVVATPNVITWTRPRWPHWPLTIRREYLDIDAKGDPLPEPGNSESDYWDGEDAIFGTGVEAGGTPREIGQRVADQVMQARKRHGAGYDWRPTREWRPKTEEAV